MSFDLRRYNRDAWNHQVATGNKWTVPVTPDVIESARAGDWSIVLTPAKPVPKAWFPADLRGVSVLGLAAGGGQQGPILAAAGATVTIFDNSPAQLEQDRVVAAREGLDIRVVEGDMRDLSALDDASFDLIVHPCSNCFVPDIGPVWRESARVLKPGGSLIAGFLKPSYFMFAFDDAGKSTLKVQYPLPYSDLTSIDAAKRDAFIAQNEPLCFSHTLTAQLGGQIDAGLALTGMFEDRFPADANDALSRYMPTFIATRSTKL